MSGGDPPVVDLAGTAALLGLPPPSQPSHALFREKMGRVTDGLGADTTAAAAAVRHRQPDPAHPSLLLRSVSPALAAAGLSADPAAASEAAELRRLRVQVGELLRCKEEMHSLRGDVSILQSAVQSKTDELARVQGSVKRIISDADDVHAGLYDKCVRYEKQLFELQRDGGTAAAKLEAELEQARISSAAQAQRCAGLEAQLADTQRSVVHEKTRLSATESQRKAAADAQSDQVARLEKEVGELAATCTTLEEKCGTFGREAAAAQETAERMERDAVSVRKQNAEQASLLCELREATEKLSLALIAAKAEAACVPELQKELARAAAATSELEQAKRAHTADRARYEVEKVRGAELAAEAKLLRSSVLDLQEAGRAAERKLESRAAAHEAEKTALKETLARAQREVEAEREQATRRAEEMRRATDDVQAKGVGADLLQLSLEAELESLKRILITLGEQQRVDYLSLAEGDVRSEHLPPKAAQLLQEFRRLLVSFCHDYQTGVRRREASRQDDKALAQQLNEQRGLARGHAEESERAALRVAALQGELRALEDQRTRQTQALHAALLGAVARRGGGDAAGLVEILAPPPEKVAAAAGLSFEAVQAMAADLVAAALQRVEQQAAAGRSLSERTAALERQLEGTQRTAADGATELQRRVDAAEAGLRTAELRVASLENAAGQRRIELQAAQREEQHERAFAKEKSDELCDLAQRFDVLRREMAGAREASEALRDDCGESDDACAKLLRIVEVLCRWCVPLMLRCDELVFHKTHLSRENAALGAAVRQYEKHFRSAVLPAHRRLAAESAEYRAQVDSEDRRHARSTFRAGVLAVIACNRLAASLGGCVTSDRLLHPSLTADVSCGGAARNPVMEALRQALPGNGPAHARDAHAVVSAVFNALLVPQARHLLRASVAGVFASCLSISPTAAPYASRAVATPLCVSRPLRALSTVMHPVAAYLRDTAAYGEKKCEVHHTARGVPRCAPHCLNPVTLLQFLQHTRHAAGARESEVSADAATLHARVGGLLGSTADVSLDTSVGAPWHTTTVAAVLRGAERVGAVADASAAAGTKGSPPVFMMIDEAPPSTLPDSAAHVPAESPAASGISHAESRAAGAAAAGLASSRSILNLTSSSTSSVSAAAASCDMDVLKYIAQLDAKVTQTLKLSRLLEANSTVQNTSCSSPLSVPLGGTGNSTLPEITTVPPSPMTMPA